jgi:hypothetical protein
MLKILRRLLSPDPADGTPSQTPSAPPSDPIKEPQKGPLAPNPAPHNPAPPITAKAVIEGTKTERELELERKLKEREEENSRLQDDNRKLKTPPADPQRQKSAEKKHWLEGGTFFDCD